MWCVPFTNDTPLLESDRCLRLTCSLCKFVFRTQENLEVLSSLSTSDKLDLKGSKSVMCTDEAMQEYEDDPDCKNIECQQMNRCGGVSQFLTDFCIFLVCIMALVSFATVN